VNSLLGLPSPEGDGGSSRAGGFRHDQPQLPLARDVQHAVVVLDHVAKGLQIPLDEGGYDFALEAAVFTLLDDPLADDDFIKIRWLIRLPPGCA
jgi:hypothetical protein